MKDRITQFMLALVLSIITIPGFAYDFEVDGIYYNKLSSGDEVEVTNASYSGDVVIPSTVTSGGG